MARLVASFRSFGFRVEGLGFGESLGTLEFRGFRVQGFRGTGLQGSGLQDFRAQASPWPKGPKSSQALNSEESDEARREVFDLFKIPYNEESPHVGVSEN